eukprot:6484804-Amphidinium_carterae.1
MGKLLVLCAQRLHMVVDVYQHPSEDAYGGGGVQHHDNDCDCGDRIVKVGCVNGRWPIGLTCTQDKPADTSSSFSRAQRDESSS